jgi:alpha-aminoadipate/glutamate carrier protein LysW
VSSSIQYGKAVERFMAICSECDSVLDFDVDDVDAGEVVVCDECGAEYEIVATDPLELSKVDNEGYEDEDALARDEEEE